MLAYLPIDLAQETLTIKNPSFEENEIFVRIRVTPTSALLTYNIRYYIMCFETVSKYMNSVTRLEHKLLESILVTQNSKSSRSDSSRQDMRIAKTMFLRFPTLVHQSSSTYLAQVLT